MNKSKLRTDKQFEEELAKAIENSKPKVPKTNYIGLINTKEGFAILKKMSWVDIEDLTDLEFYGK
jgi:hypothetical protein